MMHSTKGFHSDILESLVTSAKQPNFNKSQQFSIFKNIVRQILKAIGRGHELQVWPHRDRFGNTHWHGYNPIGDCHIHLASEAEVRIWIEERYYR
ncbi:MAG TPA: hypothetical protein DDW51_11795 [Cyanobacteria bacterium UBA11367]|nr:hypothetical protein [Cyanobacteria bacterium UBA11367]HBS68871.1 hypothetical protein [Cyanobacteria bacterium UBA11153]